MKRSPAVSRQSHGSCQAALTGTLALKFTQKGGITRKKHSRVVQVTTAGVARFSRLGLKLPG
ncbi:MAG: hypothetical protein Q7K57_46750 [Burkholderiaceae bacterium]|nr:hypothetical protein [Burkholderiaceae bacterium]